MFDKAAEGFGHGEGMRRAHDDVDGAFASGIERCVIAASESNQFAGEMFAGPGEQSACLLHLCDGGGGGGGGGEEFAEGGGNGDGFAGLQGFQHPAQNLGGLLPAFRDSFKPVERGVAGVKGGSGFVIGTQQFGGLVMGSTDADARGHQALGASGAQQRLRDFIDQQPLVVGGAGVLAGEDAHDAGSHDEWPGYWARFDSDLR